MSGDIGVLEMMFSQLYCMEVIHIQHDYNCHLSNTQNECIFFAAENNPLHDYPEEEDFGDPSEEESDKTHDSGDFDPDASDEDYDVATYNDQNNFQWSRRL